MYKRSLPERKKDAADEPQSCECMNKQGVQNQLVVILADCMLMDTYTYVQHTLIQLTLE